MGVVTEKALAGLQGLPYPLGMWRAEIAAVLGAIVLSGVAAHAESAPAGQRSTAAHGSTADRSLLAPGEVTLGKVTEEDVDGRPHVTFVGFQQLQGGGGRVFVHLTSAPSGMQSDSKELKATIALDNMHIGARNNRYPLDLQNFNLPVTRVELKARDNDVVVELSLRKEITLHPRLQKRPDGAVVLEIELPAQ